MLKHLPPVQQGAPDGLCGIYCLLNFLRTRWKTRSKNQESVDAMVFRRLIKSAGDLNLVTTEHMCSGFDWYKLQAIFNYTAEEHSLPYSAIEMIAASSLLQCNSLQKLAGTLIKKGGGLVLHLDKRDHWVLITGDQIDDLWVQDPGSDEPKEPCSFDERYIRKWKVSGSQGLALVNVNRGREGLKL